MRTYAVAIAVVAALLLTARAQAAVWTFDNIVIDGLQETPPVATPGSGFGTATLDDVTGAMSVSGTFSNLIGTTNNAHVHCCAPSGSPAGVLFGLTFDFGVTSGNFSGNAILSAADVQNVLNGLSYINIHSTFRPGGEIRGQLLNPVPEPATCLMLSLGAVGLSMFRRSSRA